MEFLLIAFLILLLLALVVGGIALTVNAIQSIKESTDEIKRMKGKK